MGLGGTVAGGSDGHGTTEMIYGQFRSRFPRLTLTLPGLKGPLDVEFILDTGFDGELALLVPLSRDWL